METGAYILDSTPLMMGYTPALGAILHYTTPEIVDELGEKEQLRLATAGRWLFIREPSKSNLSKVQKAAAETGDNLVLSRPDLSILALSLDITMEGAKVKLITDDYAIQNVASKLRLPFQDYAWRGIRRTIKWVRYCPACRKTYNTQKPTCPNCGSTLKRKPASEERKRVHVKP